MILGCFCNHIGKGIFVYVWIMLFVSFVEIVSLNITRIKLYIIDGKIKLVKFSLYLEYKSHKILTSCLDLYFLSIYRNKIILLYILHHFNFCLICDAYSWWEFLIKLYNAYKRIFRVYFHGVLGKIMEISLDGNDDWKWDHKIVWYI